MVQLYGPTGHKLSYDAIEDKGRRRSPSMVLRGEDLELNRYRRRKLVSGSRNMMRNSSILRWMIGRHLDYTTSFSFHARTGNDRLDQRLEELVRWASRPFNADAANRHSLAAIVRLQEMGVVLDGDSFLYFRNDGKIQAIEGDRVAVPNDLEKVPEPWRKRLDEHGLVLNDDGAVEAYCVCSRVGQDGFSRSYNAIVPASQMVASGEYTRFDQTRGVSPLSTALNSLADLYETWEYTLIKMKLHSLFGVVVKRAADPSEDADGGWDTAGYSGTAYASEGKASSPTRVELKNGLMSLELQPGEGVETVESKTPSNEMQDFSRLMIRAALLSLDIPFTMFDSMGSSFSARIADRAEYEESSARKKIRVQGVLDRWLDWRLRYWASSPVLAKDLSAAGMDVDRALTGCEWVAAGTPWLDKLNEVKGDEAAVSLGIDSRQRVCKRRGLDFWKVVEELAEEEAYLKEKGISYTIGNGGQAPVASEPEAAPPTEEASDESVD